MTKSPQHFVLDPLTSRAYLEAVLVDAGFDSSEADSIASVAYDCGGGDGDASWQKAQLERCRARFDEQSKDLLAKVRRLDLVLKVFYADVTSADAEAAS